MVEKRKSGSATRDAALTTACERALVASARAHQAGTRQQVRAAARRFVRRNRRDAGYLRWVLRSVTTSSALAVVLLGLAAAPAGAELTPFGAQTGAANPLNGQGVGVDSAPALADLDGDGDLDLVSGEILGTFSYFENTGDATTPLFAAPVANPFGLGGVGANGSGPVLGDLDGDGDLDLVSGDDDGLFSYFENTGSATSPAFAQHTGSANPLDGQDVGEFSRPALADLDADGDFDLVSGERYGAFLYFENTGSATSPAFAARTGTANPLASQDAGYSSAPGFADLEGDGDLDVVAGERFGAFLVFENTGSATSAAFVSRTGTANPLDGADVGDDAVPSLADLDGDGDLDLVSGSESGLFFVFENFAGEFMERTGTANPLDGQDIGLASTPALADLDADGDLDLVAGEYDGVFSYFENTGSPSTPLFIPRPGAANPLDGTDVGVSSAPTLGDLDGDDDLDLLAGRSAGDFDYVENTGDATTPLFAAPVANPFGLSGVGANGSGPVLGDLDDDGDLDLVSGDDYGLFWYFENTGSATSPAFAQRTGAANPLDGQDVGLNANPWLGDLDGDGDLDLVSGEYSGTFAYFENTGSATSPAFIPRNGTANPLDGRSVGFASTPSLGDLDGDGDLDLVSGERYGTFLYFESFVPQALTAFALTGGANPLNGQDVGNRAAPALADLDRDGDADVVAGEDLGTFLYYENTGSATDPSFISRTGAANLLDGRDVGDRAKPAFGDLDGDGDFDLLAGRSDGAFDYFANTGDATTPLFAAPVANPFGLGVGTSDSAPVLGDLDGDGDLDLVVGEYYGTFAYFENTGSRTSPAFVERTGVANPFDGVPLRYYYSPALGDFDSDGDLDLVSGVLQGRLRYFENTGSATSPAFTPLTGAANPLDGEDVGTASAPAAADLDGDGDLDLVTGAGSGMFSVHYFPEPTRGLLLGAGIALLKLLERLRSRRWRR